MWSLILRHSDFRNYFLADVISTFGTGLAFIGANWFILQQTGRNTSVGILMAVSVFSGLVVFPIAGTIADRFNRCTIITLNYLIRGIILLLIAIAITRDTSKYFLVYVMAVANGISWTIFIPASRGFIQEILEKEEFIKGTSLTEISLQVGSFTSAAACGVIYKYFGFNTILFINSFMLFVCTLFLKKIKYAPLRVHKESDSFFKQFSDGLKYLTARPVVFGYGIIMFIPFVATMSFNVVLPGYVSEYLKGGPVVFGITDMFYCLGAFSSGFIAAALVEKLGRSKTVMMYFLISTLSISFLAINKILAGLYIACFLFGLAGSSLRIIMNAHVMEIVPTSNMGRSMSVWHAISMIMQTASVYGVGVLMDLAPPQFGSLWLGLIMVVGLVSTSLVMPRANKFIEERPIT